MSQFARPDGDIAVGLWAPFPASPTTLFDKMDEATPNGDTDYIYSSVDEDECEISLQDVNDPEVGTGHTIRCYAKCPLGSGAKEQMWMALVENGNIRGQSSVEDVDRNSYALIEYTLSEAEANAIGNYANLRLRFHITKVNGGEPIQITQAEFECPDAVTEYIYDGDVPVAVLPGVPKALLSKSYAGSVLLDALPAAPIALLSKSYTGVISMVVLPDDPLALLEKSYTGAINFTLVPDSIYELLYEYVYGGDLGMGILPSYASILDRIYAGDVPMALTPSSTRILDRVYGGDVSLIVLPDSPVAPLEKSYAGVIPMSLLSSYSSILDRVYAGAISVVILPVAPVAPLSKLYAGVIGLVLTAESLYELVSGGGEFVYAGGVPLAIGSDVPNAQLEKAYQGDISMSLLLGAFMTKLGKIFVGFIKAIGVTFFPFDFPLYFRVVPREKVLEVVSRKRMFWITARDRFFDVIARVRTQGVKARKRIFKALIRRKR